MSSNAQPVTHVVLFKFNKNFDPVTAKSVLAQMRTIPGVVSLKFGPVNTSLFEGYSDRTQGYTHVLVSKHTDANAQRVYSVHPIHVAWVQFVKPVTVDKALAADVTSHL